MSEIKKEKPESVSAFAYENALMHKDADVERAHSTTRWVCVTFVIMITIFVAAYTIRTSIWLETINKMVAAIIELANVQGLPAPLVRESAGQGAHHGIHP